MNYRLIPVVAAALFSVAFTASVQAVQSQQPAAEEKMQHLSQVLNLTPQQQSQLAPIVRAEAPKVKAIQQNPNLSPKEKMKQIQAVHSQTDPLVKSILNPTQYKMWEQIRKDELDQMKKGGGL